jgi:hypothetical protein
MAGCGPKSFLQGGVIAGSRIVDPDITGGTSVNQIIQHGKVTGSLEVEETVLIDLAARLSPHLSAETAPADIAKVFRDCTNGLPLEPAVKIVTCADLEAAMIIHKAEVGTDLAVFKSEWEAAVTLATDPSKIIGTLESGGGLPLAPGTVVPTWAEMMSQIQTAASPSAISSVFKNAEGNDLPPGTRLMSAAEVNQAVKAGICEGCGGASGGASIAGMTWTSLTQTLTIVETDGSAVNSVSVTLDGIQPSFASSASAPAAGNDDYLPLDVFGARESLLGRPNLWLGPVQIGADKYVIPAYKLP